MTERTRRLLDRDEVADVLQGAFYVPQPVRDEPPASGQRLAAVPNAPSLAKAKESKEAKEALHYKVICISLYNDDLERLDGMVDELKKRGLTKASRSALIRAALEQVDLGKIRRGL